MSSPGSVSSARIVIMHQGALGDFICLLPVLEGLHDRHPEATIDLCSRKELAALLATKPYLGNAYASDASELSAFYHEALWRKTPIPRYFQDARAVFVFGQESARLIASRFAARTGCEVNWIRSFPVAGEQLPVSQYLFDQMRALGYALKNFLPQVTPHTEEQAAVGEWLRIKGLQHNRPVLIHPGSGGRKKIWPLSKWWALLRWLTEIRGCPVALALGPADEYLKNFAAAAQTLGVHLLEGVSLPRLAAFLRESLFYVGNDSGVSHLAAAVGATTVVIFGPTRPEVWAPQGHAVHIIRMQWEESAIFRWSAQTRPAGLEPAIQQVLQHLFAGDQSSFSQ